MNALVQPRLHWRAMLAGDVDTVAAIERRAYAFPWSHGNFVDSLAAGYLADLLLDGERTIGYYVAMPGAGEMHLLNLTVVPEEQGRGHGSAMLERIVQRCRAGRLASLWLEVRGSNLRARRLYARRGFCEVGVRRGYYPAPHGTREDAIVMSLVVVGGTRGVE